MLTDQFSFAVALTRWVIVPSLATAAISTCVFFVYRSIAKESSLLGHIVGLGILVRVTFGLVLFFVSFLNLPLLAGLHTGDGFWRLAPDAKAYYLYAVSAAEHGIRTISSGTPSPAYVQTLSIWMMVVGASPASALFLNLVCYVLGCAMMIVAFESTPAHWRRRASVFSVGAFTCSPTLIVFGTQPLKDTFFAFLAVLAAVGTCYVSSSFSDVPRFLSWRRMVLGLSAILAAIYLTAGIRAYYAFLVWVCLVILFITCGATRGLSGLRRVGTTACVTLAAAWIAFTMGAGTYSKQYASLMRFGGGDETHAIPMVVAARTGFIESGGGTNVASPNPSEASGFIESGGGTNVASPNPSEASASRSLIHHAGALAIGLSALFVPMSLLRGLSIVNFAGGRGMLLLTDIDTLFLDLTLLVGALILIRGWAAMRSNLPYVVFSVSLTLLLTILMAYVVTNYGTLVRLRLMLATPVWMLPLAMCRFGVRGAATTSTADFDEKKIDPATYCGPASARY